MDWDTFVQGLWVLIAIWLFFRKFSQKRPEESERKREDRGQGSSPRGPHRGGRDEETIKRPYEPIEPS